MKNKVLFLLTICLFLITFTSCVSVGSMTDRQIYFTEKETFEIVGQVETTFTQWQPLHIIRRNNILNKTYSLLLEQARFGYGFDADVRNIKITGAISPHTIWLVPVGFTVGPFLGVALAASHLLFNWIIGVGYTGTEYLGLFAGPFLGPVVTGNFQTITASGDVVIPRVREED